jgi:uncharacterized membrane protein
MHQANGGQFTGPVIGSLVGGMVLITVTATFLFSMNWAIVLPVILILLGCGVLASGLVKS